MDGGREILAIASKRNALAGQPVPRASSVAQLGKWIRRNYADATRIGHDGRGMEIRDPKTFPLSPGGSPRTRRARRFGFRLFRFGAKCSPNRNDR